MSSESDSDESNSSNDSEELEEEMIHGVQAINAICLLGASIAAQILFNLFGQGGV